MAPSTWGELDRAPLMPQFPRLVAVRPRFGAVWRPKCRPPRRKTPKLGCRRRGGLRYGHNGVKSRVLWRLVEAASFRVVVCWFSACCGVMPPRARWGRRVLYQWTQAAVSRSTSRRSRHGRVAGARLVVDQFCFVQGVQRLGQGVNPFKQKTDTQTIKHVPWLILHGCSAIAAPLTLSAHTWSSFARTPGIEGYSYPHDETIVFNVDFPAPASRKVATKPTRFVL